MPRNTVKRPPDMQSSAAKNAGWFMLPRREFSSSVNMTIVAPRFEVGGGFEEHAHEEQFFYVSKGRLEMSIGGEGDFVSMRRRAWNTAIWDAAA